MKTQKAMEAAWKKLVGKTIVDVQAHAFETDEARDWTSDPTIIFSDGTRLCITVDETEIGEYGVSPVIVPKAKTRHSKACLTKNLLSGDPKCPACGDTKKKGGSA